MNLVENFSLSESFLNYLSLFFFHFRNSTFHYDGETRPAKLGLESKDYFIGIFF